MLEQRWMNYRERDEIMYEKFLRSQGEDQTKKEEVNMFREEDIQSQWDGHVDTRGLRETLEGFLVAGGHGPGPLHPPDGEGVAQSFVGQVVAAGQLGVHLVALQHLVEEVDVS